MCLDPAVPGEEPAEDYSGWPLPDRLTLLAFDARLPGVPQVIRRLSRHGPAPTAAEVREGGKGLSPHGCPAPRPSANVAASSLSGPGRLPPAGPGGAEG
jgi:hypothetical protein